MQLDWRGRNRKDGQAKGLKYKSSEPGLAVFQQFSDADREKSRRQPYKEVSPTPTEAPHR